MSGENYDAGAQQASAQAAQQSAAAVSVAAAAASSISKSGADISKSTALATAAQQETQKGIDRLHVDLGQIRVTLERNNMTVISEIQKTMAA